jgi:hypothetical protein
MSGLRAFQRRSFLQGVVSGLAGAVVAGSVDHGVARADTEDDYNQPGGDPRRGAIGPVLWSQSGGYRHRSPDGRQLFGLRRDRGQPG